MKHDFKHRTVSGQVVMGIIAIGFGALFLLDNLDIWNFRRFVSFWPMVLIVFGAVKIYDSRSTNGLFIGGALILAGIMMTMHRLGYVYLNWRSVWPVLVIAAGVAIVYKAIRGRDEMDATSVDLSKEDDSVINVSAILGGFQRRIVSQAFRGGEVTAIMGGCELDLRQASMGSGEAVINVFALCGGISIKVPPDWNVVLQGTPILGGFDERTNAAADSGKRLIIKGYAIMGGLEVRS
jgi:predicted membrane protein